MKTMIGHLLAAVTAISLLVSCSVRSPLVGKWQEVGGDETVEFLKDGTFNVLSKGRALGGKYSLVEGDRIKLEVGGLGDAAHPAILSASIAGGELSVTDPKGRISRYRRAK
jgi:hypothetical protein